MSEQDPKDRIIEALKVSQLDLRAENARLRRSGANVSGLLIGAVETGSEAIAETEQERDGYKALVGALEQALNHCEELREAWERGALDERDGLGGTRSNRNVAVVIALHAVLADTSPAAAALLAQARVGSEAVTLLKAVRISGIEGPNSRQAVDDFLAAMSGEAKYG